MNVTFMFLLMVFLHIIDDFHLQGCLKDMKQSAWWRSHPQYKPLYKYDYIVALAIHSFSWAFMVMLPIAIVRNFNVDSSFVWVLVISAFVHGFIDDWKANCLKINLVIDQLLHLMQLIIILAYHTMYIGGTGV